MFDSLAAVRPGGKTLQETRQLPSIWTSIPKADVFEALEGHIWHVLLLGEDIIPPVAISVTIGVPQLLARYRTFNDLKVPRRCGQKKSCASAPP